MDDLFTARIKTSMQKALEVTKTDLGTIRTGRATPALVDHIEVIAYGSQRMKVRELATVGVADAQTLVIHPFDPSTKDDIIKGIQEANTGLNPVSDGDVVRIAIPSLSAERRQEYIKLAHAKLEAGRVMIRQVRHEEMAKLKRAFEATELTEDEIKRQEKQIQEVTDEMIAEIDLLGDLKEKELMQI